MQTTIREAVLRGQQLLQADGVSLNEMGKQLAAEMEPACWAEVAHAEGKGDAKSDAPAAATVEAPTCAVCYEDLKDRVAFQVSCDHWLRNCRVGRARAQSPCTYC